MSPRPLTLPSPLTPPSPRSSLTLPSPRGRGFDAGQRGFSLVEVMVAMAVSLVLLAGVAQVFTSTKVTYRLQDSLSVLQENARFGLGQIEYAVRMADHWGGVESSALTASAATASSSCDSGYAVDTVGIMGYEEDTTPPGDLSGCIPGSDYQANTDILVLRYASIDNVVAAAASMDADTLYVRTATGTRGEIIKGDDTLPSDLPDESITASYPYVFEAYFVRPCSDPSGGSDTSQCDSGDDDGQPIPTLTRLALEDDAVVQEEVVEGIEQMQVAYGIDTDSDDQVNQYVAAGGVTNWGNVMSVKISLVARSLELDTSYTDANATYTLAGGYSYDPDENNENLVRSHYRKVFTKVIQIRNRNRS